MRETLFTKFGINTYNRSFQVLLALLFLYLFSVISDVLYATSTTASSTVKVLLLIGIVFCSFVIFNRKQRTLPQKAQQKTEKIFVEPIVLEKKDEFEGVYDLPSLRTTLESKGSEDRGRKQKEFFKGQEGEYEQGDAFWGVNIADIVRLAEEYHPHLNTTDIKTLLASNVHDERIVGLWVLINKYQASTNGEQADLFDFYFENRDDIRNWNTVDLAARNIVGIHLKQNQERQEEIHRALLASDSLWDKRTLIMSTDPFIEAGDTHYTFNTISLLLNKDIELIQSGIGWVLKESYKYSPEETEHFIKEKFLHLSKQAIRIGTERMEKETRKAFLRGEIS